MNLNQYKIDRKSHPILIYIGLLMIFANIFIYFRFRDVDINNPFALFDNDAKPGFIFESILLIIRITMTIIAFVIAKRLMRSGILWAILVFIFPPISLIILGILDMSIDSQLKKTLDQHRVNYFAEVLKIKNDLKRNKNSDIDLKPLIEGCKQKHQALLTKALNARQIEIDKAYTDEWMNDTSKCPACGTNVKESDKLCPKCGLHFV